MNCFGLYGLYESIDFTPNRMLVGDTYKVVQEYMVHHQGMILMSLVNYFHKDIMVNRMHGDPRIQSVELLLQEQIPQSVPLQNPFAEDVKGILRLTAAPVEIKPWSVPVHTAIPQVNLLSNGNYWVLLSNMGGGYSTCQRDRPDPLAGRRCSRPVGDLDLHPGYGPQRRSERRMVQGFGQPGINPSLPMVKICR